MPLLHRLTVSPEREYASLQNLARVQMPVQGPIGQFKILKSLRGRLVVRLFQVNTGEAAQAAHLA